MKSMHEFKQGLNCAAGGIAILKEHLNLLSYAAIAALVRILIEMVLFNSYTSCMSTRLPFITAECAVNGCKAGGALGLVGLLFHHGLSNWIAIFTQVALILHAAHILEGSMTTVRASLARAWDRVRLITLWAAIVTLVTLSGDLWNALWVFIAGKTAMPAWMGLCSAGASIFFLVWSIATLFVPVIIALEPISIMHSVRRSMRVVTRQIYKIIAGYGILFVLALLLLVPLIVLDGVCERYSCSVTKWGLLLAALEIFAEIVISTVNVIIKTLIYEQDQDEQEALVELELLKYPSL